MHSTLSVLLVWIAIGSVIPTHAQHLVPSTDSDRLIDSGLQIIGMVREDCAMPPDMISADEHRLPFHDSLFSHPLTAFERAGRYTNDSWTRDHATAVLKQAMSDLGLGDYHSTSYSLRRSPDQLKKKLNADLLAHTDLAGSVVLLRIVEAILDAHEATEDARKRWNSLSILRDQCDSIWMNAEEDPHASLFEGVTEARKARKVAEQFFRTANPVAMNDLYVQGAGLYLHLLQILDDALVSHRTLKDSVKTVIIESTVGRIALGGPGPDVYSGAFAVIIDVGGNDVYTNTSGTKASSIATPISVIIDMDGNDTYIGSGYTFGSGVAGIGLLLDNAGNDVYNTGDFSLGCGVFGVGIVHDRAGNDAYLSGQNGQGAGMFGIGLLIDESGHDTYRAHAQAQGFGATRGFGMLFDAAGNDQYLAASPYVDVLRYEAHYVTFTQGAALGHRPIASGGIGLLVDLEGNDHYGTDIYGQGTGYWFGLGALIDRKGEDRYQAYQYAQGSGVHFATGLLLDADGDDVYASHGVSQGCGHDFALGALVDEHGADVYSVESLSLGGGNANAVSIFVDRTGDDSYAARDTTNTMGFSDFRRWTGMIGVFVDGGGHDRYTQPSKNNEISVKSTYGTFVDQQWITDTVPSQPPPTYVNIPLADDLDSLFVQASAAPLKYQNNVEPARVKLASMGKPILEDLALYFDTDMPRERLALEFILPKMRESDSMVIDSLIVAGLTNEDLAERNLCATVAGKVKSVAAVPTLLTMATDPSWKVRRLAALTLGQIGDQQAIPMLIRLLSDQHAYVRARAGYSLGTIGDTSALNEALVALADPTNIVRSTTAEGFSRGAKHHVSEIIEIWKKDPHYQSMITKSLLLRSCDTTAADQQVFATYYQSLAVSDRLAIDRMLPSLPAIWSRARTPLPEIKKAKRKRSR